MLGLFDISALSLPKLLYIGSVLLLGIAGLQWLRRLLAGSEARGRRLLSRLKRLDAIAARPPVSDADGSVRERTLRNMESRFSINRRVLIPAYLLLFGVVSVLPLLHKLSAAYLSFFLGIVSVIAGIAARPFIENVISGLVLSFGKPFNIGDTVIVDENYGTVEDISLTFSTIKMWDWTRYIVPNSQMLSKSFRNLSLVEPVVWAHINFWVSHDANLDRVQQLAQQAGTSSEHYAGQDPPAFWVVHSGQEGIRCWVAAWASSPPAAWLLQADMRRSLSELLAREGIRSHTWHHHTSSEATPPDTRSDATPPAHASVLPSDKRQDEFESRTNWEHASQ